MNELNKKKMKGAATLTLAAALLVTGSLAWQDVTQHKTNNFATKSVAHSMVLVEDFEPIEGWTLGQDIVKEVSVRNGQKSDDTTRYAYNDGYVRLQIREFMGIAEQTYVTSDDRLMIKTDGNFYRFATEQDAKDEVQNLELTSERIVELKGINDDQNHWYLKSAAGDANGQYGKFLIVDITEDSLKSIVDNSVVTDLDKDVTDKHNSIDGKNEEDGLTYTTHFWEEGQDNFTPSADKFSEYVKWTLGADVITLQQWKDNYHSKPVAKWIVDTSDSTDGYVYWGQRLNHATTADANSLTSKLLEKVTLIKQPQGHAEYRIHVNMDAVSFDELDNWGTTNEFAKVFKDTVALQDGLKQLNAAITRVSAISLTGKTVASAQAVTDAITAAQTVRDAGSSVQDMKDAIAAMDAAVAALVNEPVTTP